MRVLLLCGLLVAAGATKVTPVQGAINQLQKMVKTGQNEIAEEKKLYAAFKQWCGDMEYDKNNEIEDGELAIEELSSKISKNEATIEKMTTEIDAHQNDLDTAEGDLNAANNVRAIELQDYTEKVKDYTESIDALQGAIATLKSVNNNIRERADEGTTSATYYESTDAANKGALLQVQNSAFIPESAKKVITAFLQSDKSDDDQAEEDAEDDFDEKYKKQLSVRAGKANIYEPSVGKVIDMLQKLYKDFDKKREELKQTETSLKHHHANLVQDLENLISNSKDNINEKTQRRATNQEELADNQAELKMTKDEKAKDEAYLAEWQGVCANKKDEFGQRQKLRAEELDTLGRVIDVLKESAAPKEAHLLQTSTSLLQVVSSNAPGIMVDVAHLLSDRADSIHSNALSQLATAIGTGNDPFVKVRGMIEDLITTLTKEAGSEAEQKAWCDKELKMNKMERQTRTNQVADLTAEIERLTAEIAQLGEEITEHGKKIAEIQAAKAEAADNRAEEAKANDQTIRDAQEGQKAIALAMQILKDFYAKASGATSLIQDTPAPPTWDTSYTGMQNLKGGVQAMLEVIMSDFARSETDTQAVEEQQDTDFKKFNQDADLDIQANTQDMTFKESKKKQDEAGLVTAKKDVREAQVLLDKSDDYYAKLKPPCVKPDVDFAERSRQRGEEIEALQEALSLLTGEANNETGANV